MCVCIYIYMCSDTHWLGSSLYKNKKNQRKTMQSTEIDIYRYLIGTWKRCLEYRQFGGLFQHLSTSNTIVLIEEYNRVQDISDVSPNARYLRWSFGNSTNRSDLQFGYEMKVMAGTGNVSPLSNGSIVNSALPPSLFQTPDQAQKQTTFEWHISGTLCRGHYYHESKVAIFNFILKSSIVTVTYRIIDESTMAVAIIEVDNSGSGSTSIQYGNMYRL